MGHVHHYKTRGVIWGGWGAVAPPPRKKKKRKKERKKEKREKRKKERKKGTMNNVKLLHIKCCFFQFFNSPVALKNIKKLAPPQEKVEMTPLDKTWQEFFFFQNQWYMCIYQALFGIVPWSQIYNLVLVYPQSEPSFANNSMLPQL